MTSPFRVSPSPSWKHLVVLQVRRKSLICEFFSKHLLTDLKAKKKRPQTYLSYNELTILEFHKIKEEELRAVLNLMELKKLQKDSGKMAQ